MRWSDHIHEIHVPALTHFTFLIVNILIALRSPLRSLQTGKKEPVVFVTPVCDQRSVCV